MLNLIQIFTLNGFTVYLAVPEKAKMGDEAQFLFEIIICTIQILYQ